MNSMFESASKFNKALCWPQRSNDAAVLKMFHKTGCPLASVSNPEEFPPRNCWGFGTPTDCRSTLATRSPTTPNPTFPTKAPTTTVPTKAPTAPTPNCKGKGETCGIDSNCCSGLGCRISNPACIVSPIWCRMKCE
jgi:hypothetical protein